MTNALLTREQAEAAWNVVKQYGAIATAAKAAGVSKSTMEGHYNAAVYKFGFEKVHRPKGMKIKAAAPPIDPPAPDTPEARKDVRDAAFWRKKAAELQKQLGDAEHIAEELAGVRHQKIVIPDWIIARGSGKPGRAVVGLFVSDVHAGEVVSLDELNGLNQYDIEVCRRRLRRLFSAACDVPQRWIADCDCQGAFLALGGDLISGSIHNELVATNELTSHEQVRFVVEEVASGIRQLLKAYGKVHVASVPGNHGRTTIKSTAKLYSRLSYDTMAADMIADRFMGDKRVSFQIGVSTDQIVPIFGYSILLTHGDKAGSGGGQGFGGPDLPIVRGGKKISEQQASVGRKIDYILRGHLHYSTHPGNVLANGSVVGLSEYGNDLRGRVQPPKQWLFLMHSKWGLRERLDVQLEDPTLPEKPRVRVYV